MPVSEDAEGFGQGEQESSVVEYQPREGNYSVMGGGKECDEGGGEVESGRGKESSFMDEGEVVVSELRENS